VLHVEGLAILLTSDDGRAFAVRTALDDELVDGPQIPIHWNLVGRIVRTRRPIAVENPSIAAHTPSALRLRCIRAVLGVPLLLEGRAIGILQISTREPRQFTEGELLVLQLTARAALTDRCRYPSHAPVR
jgi:GAF domain-containing protein